MSIVEFFEILQENLLTYLIALSGSFLLFYFIFKKSASSWLNPIRFNILSYSIGFSVAIFLFLLNYVKLQLFVYLCFSLAIFWITFVFIHKNKQRVSRIKISNETELAKYLFLLAYFLYIFFTLLSYKLLGIPIFNEDSRLTTYTGSGLGFIARMLPVLFSYVVFYIFHLLHTVKAKKRKILIIILLIPIIIFGVLTGSRSSFLGIVFVFWGYKTFFVGEEPDIKNFKWLIVPFIIISLFTFSIESRGDLGAASFHFVERIVASGDLYWESLPDETWKAVVIKKPFEFIFMGFLGPLRILNATHAETPIGYQLTNIVYSSDRSTGPVALFPMFGLICFGYIGGCLFSFLQALLIALLLKVVYLRSGSLIISAMAYYSFFNILNLLSDISAGLGACLDIIINYIFMFVLLMIAALIHYWSGKKRSSGYTHINSL